MNFVDMFKDWQEVKEYPAKTVIFSEKDVPDVMYVILKGEVEFSLAGEPLGIESEGGVFGEMAMITNSTRSATATCLTKVKLAQLNREQFRQVLEQNADFSLKIMSVLVNRLRAADHFIATEFGRSDVRFS